MSRNGTTYCCLSRWSESGALKGEEADALDEAMRADYEPFFESACASGMRLKEA